MWTRWRSNLRQRLSVLIDSAEVAVLLTGGSLALIFGKFLAAGIFGVLAVGVARRFFRRTDEVLRARPPLWTTIVSAFAAVVAAGAIVEAINLPIRYDQTGFEKSNLLIVVALVLLFYGLAGALLRRMTVQRTGQSVTKRELGRSI